MNYPKLLMNLCIVCWFTFILSFMAYSGHEIEFTNEKYNEFSLLQMNIHSRLPNLLRGCRKWFGSVSQRSKTVDFSSFDGTHPRQKSSLLHNIRDTNCHSSSLPPPLPKRPPVGDPYNPERSAALLSRKFRGVYN
ncbi:Signal peptide containing protein [Cryptosporidium tyzzeri]|nr:Signal peptide containing protein [Cryptosporidium tyzzeri]